MSKEDKENREGKRSVRREVIRWAAIILAVALIIGFIVGPLLYS